jgi:uncharacterized protein involved in response to NO
MAGYLLAALPHWLKEAGRAAAPLAGGRLAALVAVWLAGRLAGFGPGQGALGTALQLAFPLLLSLVLLAAVLRARLWTRLRPPQSRWPPPLPAMRRTA